MPSKNNWVIGRKDVGAGRAAMFHAVANTVHKLSKLLDLEWDGDRSHTADILGRIRSLHRYSMRFSKGNKASRRLAEKIEALALTAERMHASSRVDRLPCLPDEKHDLASWVVDECKTQVSVHLDVSLSVKAYLELSARDW